MVSIWFRFLACKVCHMSSQLAKISRSISHVRSCLCMMVTYRLWYLRRLTPYCVAFRSISLVCDEHIVHQSSTAVLVEEAKYLLQAGASVEAQSTVLTDDQCHHLPTITCPANSNSVAITGLPIIVSGAASRSWVVPTT